MKRKIITTIVASIFLGIILVGCGKGEPMATNNTIAETEVVEEKASTETIEAEAEAENEEVLHEHNFVEVVTKEPTCTETGEKTLTCECGETKTEEIQATGHEFTEYVSNEDATYEADGTETAKCNNCEETDTRVVEESMLTYSFEDMSVTKYVKSTVNVRNLPNSDGDKLGGLELNDEVNVTGKCVETGWYRIEYNGSIAYVSDSYLVDNKIEVAKVPASNSNSDSTPAVSNNKPTYATYEDAKAYAISLGYPIASATANDDGTAMVYTVYAANKSTGSSSFDYGAASSNADLNASRDAAEDLLGIRGHYVNWKTVSKTKIANCDANYDWVVETMKYYHESAYCTCGQ